MTRKTTNVFVNEILSKPPKKNYSTNKTDVYCFDNIWSVDILDLKDYGPEKKRGVITYVLFVIDKFSKIGQTVPFNGKKAQTIQDSSENILVTSIESSNLIEKNRGIVFIQKFHWFVK